MGLVLREYQAAAVADLRRSLRSGHRAPLLVAPTGSGKTVIIADIVRSAALKGTRVLFLAPRRELIFQCADKLAHAGVDHGLIIAGEEPDDRHPVQVACIPTIMRRAKLRGMPKFGLVIQDESHIGVGGESGLFLKGIDCPRIGFTATPARTDGRGLGELYDDIVLGPSVAKLTSMGFLVPVKYFAPSNPDLTGVTVTAGDYNQKQLGHAMDKVTLVGDVVANWARLAPTRKTIVASVTVAHSLHLRDAFRAVGVKAEHVDGSTPTDERAQLLRRFKRGDFQVLCNCEITTYGYDEPSVDCIVLAKPTKSIARYLQIAGRGLRPFEGKQDMVLIDHSGAVESLGFVDDVFPWSLDGEQKVQEAKASREKLGERKQITCPQCKTVFHPAPSCPECGYTYQRKGKAVATTDAELVEVTRKDGKKANRTWTHDMKRRFYAELLQYSIERVKNASWRQAMWKNKFGVWIRGMDGIKPLPVSMETASWIRAQGIRYSKRMEKARQTAPVHAGATEGAVSYPNPPLAS